MPPKKLLICSLLFLLSLHECMILVHAADDDDNDDEGIDDGEGDDAVGDIPEDEGVLVLTDKNFDSALETHPSLLVEFYAPWCGHCKSLAPHYSAAAKRLNTLDIPARLAKVDATVETEVAARFEVSGYPTLKFFRDGQPTDYDGPREEDGIVSWVRERADPDWSPPASDVLVLTEENFTQTVDESELVLVEFYAPWCGHCKRLAPEYEQAATLVKSYHEPISLAKVDATAEAALAERFEVTGYPTLFIFRRGRKYEYKGPRTGRDMAAYMIQQSGLCSEQLNNTKQLKNKMYDSDLTIIGYFDSPEDSLYNTYMEAGNEIRDDFRFGHTFDQSARSQFKAKANTIVLYHPERFGSKFEKAFYVFDRADASAEDLRAFYREHEVPLVGHRNKETEQRRYSSRKPLVVVYYTVDFGFDYRDNTQHWRKKILPVANEFKQLTFAISDEDEYQTEFKDMGLDTTGEEINVAVFGPKGEKYPMEPEEEFSTDTLRDFVDRYVSGDLKPFLKSQPAPKKNDGPVKIVVGKTFEKIVNDKDKDVLIEFYAPWCGHCKKLEPEYKEVAKRQKKSNPDLVVAKIDATANDYPSDFVVEGYPTIYYVGRGAKDTPIKMEGGARDREGIEKFISESKKGRKEEL